MERNYVYDKVLIKPNPNEDLNKEPRAAKTKQLIIGIWNMQPNRTIKVLCTDMLASITIECT